MASLPHSPYTQGSHAQDTSNPTLKHEPSFSSMPSNLLQPTWLGYVADTSDALALFQGAIDGVLRKVVRRPHDRERPEVIRSGAVFIYEESASGIKRWTDGVPWSPSRILGNFLIYRELEKPFPPGEKKRAAKKIKSSSRPGVPYPPRGANPYDDGMSIGVGGGSVGVGLQSPSSLPRTTQSHLSGSPSPTKPDSPNSERESERSLVGSLTDSYAFRDGGLVKKTLSINYEGGHLHLVSYYIPEDVKENRLSTRADDPRVNTIQVRPELIQQQNFRSPIEGAAEDAMPTTNTPSSYRSSLPLNQYISGGTSSPTNYMPPSYQMPQQQGISQTPNSYYNPIGSNHHPDFHTAPGYGSAVYSDFARAHMPPNSTSPPVGGIGQYHPVHHGSSQMMSNPDQSSYLQHQSYPLQDARSQHIDHYGGHYKQEWPHDGHSR